MLRVFICILIQPLFSPLLRRSEWKMINIKSVADEADRIEK